ncbi:MULTISPECIES: site-specific integrase [Thiorhodovibrio]|uniref:site-specific integrase n=1 Tax=Thiorhodovibrio TaxID=61593 RepID=UPI00389A92EB
MDSRGKRIRCSTGTKERKEAEALLSQWKTQTYQEREWGREPVRTFEDTMVHYLRHVSDRRSLPSIQCFVSALRVAFAGKDMTHLEGSEIMEYVGRRKDAGLANSSINRELEVLSAAINYVRHYLEWKIPNPVEGRMLKEPQGRVRWLRHEEADKLVEAARSSRSPYLADLIILALNTGMRRNEMLGLRWTQVDLKSSTIHLEAVETKSGKYRSVPLNQTARKALLARARWRAENLPDCPLVFVKKDGKRVYDARKGFLAACAKVGIEDFRFHDLRHTCAAWLVTAGVPLTEVRDLLGHSSVTMTERYAHLAPDRIRYAVTVLDESRSRHAEPDDIRCAAVS